MFSIFNILLLSSPVSRHSMQSYILTYHTLKDCPGFPSAGWGGGGGGSFFLFLIICVRGITTLLEDHREVSGKK